MATISSIAAPVRITWTTGAGNDRLIRGEATGLIALDNAFFCIVGRHQPTPFYAAIHAAAIASG